MKNGNREAIKIPVKKMKSDWLHEQIYLRPSRTGSKQGKYKGAIFSESINENMLRIIGLTAILFSSKKLNNIQIFDRPF